MLALRCIIKRRRVHCLKLIYLIPRPWIGVKKYQKILTSAFKFWLYSKLSVEKMKWNENWTHEAPILDVKSTLQLLGTDDDPQIALLVRP